MKKILSYLLLCALLLSMVGCSSQKVAKTNVPGESQISIGMTTDSGSIDDKSFNQGTYEGIKRAGEEFNLKHSYLQPDDETLTAYMTAFSNLVDSGYDMIIAPGYKFENAIYEAQEKYENTKFVLIDGIPNDGNGNSLVGRNTVSIKFKECESGFLAAIATAVELKEGELGFIGGMEIPSVVGFIEGYKQGIEYANTNFGTKMILKDENIVYAGSFVDSAMGQQLSAVMYDKGVKCIFAAAGLVGTGVITEAKARAISNQDVYVVGVDVDQYCEGIYDGEKSVILTSAMKRVDNASYQMIKDALDGKFPGGQSLIMDVTNGAVGIPDENPNLSDETEAIVNQVLEDMKSGKIVVTFE